MSDKPTPAKRQSASLYSKVWLRFAKSGPVYYIDPGHRHGIVKEYPDGRKELVTYRGSEEIVLEKL